MDARRHVPRTDAVLADARLRDALGRHGHVRVKSVVVAVLARVRDGELRPDEVVDAALEAMPSGGTTLRPVINATGVVLHTNLGRAALSNTARDAVLLAAGHVDVEFDLGTGVRARRGRGALDALAHAVPAAPAVHVVNNGAAALLLAVAVLAARPPGTRREIVISRGEMVEIGDGFRLPDLIESSGAVLREVGTTNRTELADYRRALGPDTAAVLKVHPSNFRVHGFTSSVSVAELAGLGPPVVVDVGSGLLAPHDLLPDEPDVTSVLADGAAIVTCSADKLLGGPQAGLIFGADALVEQLRRDPLARALRVDKLTLAALEATVVDAEGNSPTWTALTSDENTLRDRCSRLANTLGARLVPSIGRVGGGGGVGVDLPGWAVALEPELASALRALPTPVVGRVAHGMLLLDLRCVPSTCDEYLANAVRTARTKSR